MEQILDQLVQQDQVGGGAGGDNGDEEGTVVQDGEDAATVPNDLDDDDDASPNDEVAISTSDLNPNIDEVFKVLKSFDDDFNPTPPPPPPPKSSSPPLQHHHHFVPPPPVVVDKATLAEEKYAKLSKRQVDLERRFHNISRRINLLRCRHVGVNTTNELIRLRNYVEKVVPPPPAPPQAVAGTSAPRSVTSLTSASTSSGPLNLKPPPDGILLPSVPLSASTGSEDVKVKEEAGSETDTATTTSVPVCAPAMNRQEKEKADEVLGNMESNLRHLIQGYDSEATESSSGGESCDEHDNFSPESLHYVPVKKRAKYTWLSNRASIAAKWTWLTAQISDLEYRIRQQTEFYRQIRTTKGPVTLGEPVISWPPHAKKAVVQPPPGSLSGGGVGGLDSEQVPLSCKPATKDYSRTDSQGRKIIIREPSSPNPDPSDPGGGGDSSDNDASVGACRTRPLKQVRRRQILATQGLYRTSTRAAKESSVRCDCIHPNVWCSICFGRTNHTQVPDHVTQDRNQCLALLDHGYHQVLSAQPQDVSLHLQLMHRIKNRSWLANNSGSTLNQMIRDGDREKKKIKKLKKEEASEEGSGSTKEGGKKTRKNAAGGNAASGNKVKKKDREGVKKLKSQKSQQQSGDTSEKQPRRKSLTIHHLNDDRGIAAINDLSMESGGDSMYGADGSPGQSPMTNSGSNATGNCSQAWAEHIRKRRETDFDINNIVIPYSIAAATRVERLKYKEILTPTWRSVDEKCGKENKGVNSNSSGSSNSDVKKQLELKDSSSSAKNNSSSNNRDSKTSADKFKPQQVSSDNSNNSQTGKGEAAGSVVAPKPPPPTSATADRPPIVSSGHASKKQKLDDSATQKTDNDDAITNDGPAAAANAVDDQPSRVDDDAEEEISFEIFEARHAKAELEEQRRWQTPLYKTTGGQRSRSHRRQDSRTQEVGAGSGYNTPDNPLSPGMVERVDTLEVNTRPSTPTEDLLNSAAGSGASLPTTPTMAASIRNRRRTSSATKSRDRNPSEDTQASSRCTTPTGTTAAAGAGASSGAGASQPASEFAEPSLEVNPFDDRAFPLTDEDYQSMLEDMPNGHDVPAIGEDPNSSSKPALQAASNNSSSAAAASKTANGGRKKSRRNSLELMEDLEDELEEMDAEEDDPDWNGAEELEEDPDDPEWTETKGSGADGESASQGHNSHWGSGSQKSQKGRSK